ncbi:MAG: hypothetical protein EXR86_14385 [Gammaproteobacteria bacterium]|nr:hypothetical protein [Gammaproteobacteria bacterium]
MLDSGQLPFLGLRVANDARPCRAGIWLLIGFKQSLQILERLVPCGDQRRFVVVNQVLLLQNRLIALAKTLAPLHRHRARHAERLHDKLFQREAGVKCLAGNFDTQVHQPEGVLAVAGPVHSNRGMSPKG